ncbi:MAG: rhomboid family intramembrane serine protease [Phycisphaerae bacterium]
MLPIRDNNPTHSTAYVTISLIVLNCLIFLFEVWGPVDQTQFTWKYGFVPAELVRDSDGFRAACSQEIQQQFQEDPAMHRQVTDRWGRPLYYRGRPVLLQDKAAIKVATQATVENAVGLPGWLNIFTCMFLHGGWTHLIGNMLFLWIFGNGIEDRLGPWLFLIFYLGTGVCGNLLHTYFDPGFVPLVGASGAISGVMGGYILLFPFARILAIVPIGWYPATISLPAWSYLGIYILLQNLWPAFSGAGKGNVAYWAHIGGFASGMALIHAFPHHKRPPPARPAHDSIEDDADFVL